MDEIFSLSIIELAKFYRLKEISPLEFLKATLERAKEKNAELNAFISFWEEESLGLALKSEQIFLKNESAHILEGIPFSVKDLFYTKDKLTTCGSRILKNFIPDFTAAAVEKLTDAGAILFGKTNMLEFAYGIVHEDFGKCNNPWDITKTSGGSSSGSAASIAANIGCFSLGTDTGGSIRIPSSYCGIVGLKPTYNLISTNGVFPLSKSLDHVGPITRTVEDLKLVFDAMTAKNSCFYHEYPFTCQSDSVSSDSVQFKRIGILPDSFMNGINIEVKNCYEQSLEVMRNIGFDIIPIQLPNIDNVLEILIKILLPEASYIHMKWLNRSEDYAPLTFLQIQNGLHIPAVDYIKANDEMFTFRNHVNRIFDDYQLSAIVTPTVPFPAPDEDPGIEDGDINEALFTGLFNVSGHPAITVNGGFTMDGLPIGIQFVGQWLGETELLHISQIFETYSSVSFKRKLGNKDEK